MRTHILTEIYGFFSATLFTLLIAGCGSNTQHLKCSGVLETIRNSTKADISVRDETKILHIKPSMKQVVFDNIVFQDDGIYNNVMISNDRVKAERKITSSEVVGIFHIELNYDVNNNKVTYTTESKQLKTKFVGFCTR